MNRKHHKQIYPAYPNAASPVFLRNRALDVITAILSGIGLITAFLYLMLL